MKVSVGQIYIEPGVDFPFSHHMQRRLSEALTATTGSSTAFQKKYGVDFNLTIRISANTGTALNQIKGPSVFRKTKDIEFTIFLPFDVIISSTNSCRVALEHIIDGTHSVFQKAGINTETLDHKKHSIIDDICSDPTMLTKPWPYK